AAIDDVYLVRTEAHRRATAVHRRKTAAQHGHALADEYRLAEVDLLQERQARHHAFECTARHLLVVGVRQRIGEHTAGANVDGVVVVQEVGQLHVAADGRVELDLDAESIQILVALFARHLTRQTPDGDATDHHA